MERLTPEFILEASWEVCNKMGGIYTVLSTRANVMVDEMGKNLAFIGPDLWQGVDNPLFEQDPKVFAGWAQQARQEGVNVRTGRWLIPGKPQVILVDFQPYYAIRDQIYGAAWTEFGVDSLHGYGDYDEASMFSYAAGRVVESFYNHYLRKGKKRVVYQAHEWMAGLGALYVRNHVPEVATIFTTHATSIGRSIAGNSKPLYDYLPAYNGTQMARELNVEAKHSIERQTAHHVDCFTTVSDITARECAQLLDTPCHAVLLNGFENGFVPSKTAFPKARKAARAKMLRIANALTGAKLADDTMIVATSGRYEYKNKGIDVFIEAMARLGQDDRLGRDVVAFIQVPAWEAGPRHDLAERLGAAEEYTTPLHNPVITHYLHNEADDAVLGAMRWFGIDNRPGSRVKVIFVPCYLSGHGGLLNTPYYDLLIGADLCIYPSYYEPWGYTPLEAVAFSIPCVTTSLSGFGLWANAEKGGRSTITDGVEVIERTDYNYHEVVEAVKDTALRFAQMGKKEVTAARAAANALAQKALWKHFIEHYREAYDIALRNAELRNE